MSRLFSLVRSGPARLYLAAAVVGSLFYAGSVLTGRESAAPRHDEHPLVARVHDASRVGGGSSSYGSGYRPSGSGYRFGK